MKKLIVLALLFTHSISIHASESQSWVSRNLNIIAGVSAAATGALAGIALWQWNKVTDRKATYNKAIADKPNLAGEQAELKEVLESNERMLEGHMNKLTYHIDGEVEKLRKKKPKKVVIEYNLLQWEAVRAGHLGMDTCTPCALQYRNSSPGGYAPRRQTACELASKAHSGLKTTVTTRKAVVDKDLTAAENAIDKDGETDFKHLLWRTKVIGCTSAAVSAAWLGVLYLNKSKTGK